MLGLRGEENDAVVQRYEHLILNQPKVCSKCGVINVTTELAVVCVSGHLWFNCSAPDCGSTLMIPSQKQQRKAA